jgi:hypothetical protein
VRFPSDFSLNTASPRIRVAQKNPLEGDARKWDIDSETEHQLTESRAFRYYQHLKVAALRVSNPIPTLTVHPSIYESKAPYGVICLGSELAECPLAQLRLPEEVQKLIVFQQSMNSMLFRAVKEIILEG